jgi:hypothetical protein
MNAWITIALGIVLYPAMTSPAFCAGRLLFTIGRATESTAETVPASRPNSGIVRVSIRNDGDSTLLYSPTSIPYPSSKGYLTSNQLKVVSSSGEEATYIGANVEYDTAGEEPREALKPGEATVRDLDLAKNYELVPGETYVVELRKQVGYWPDGKSISASRVLSGYITVNIPRFSFTYIPDDTGGTTPISKTKLVEATPSCIEDAAARFSATSAVALTIANDTAEAVSLMYHQDSSEPPITTFPYNARFLHWVGAHQSPGDKSVQRR